MKQNILNHLKNIYGWRTKRKLVIIVVDDYGNVRLDSPSALQTLKSKGFLTNASRFDLLDSLENTQDLIELFSVLQSVKDSNGQNAIFTPLALPCNINFEKIIEDDFQNYQYETLPETYGKLESLQPSAYNGTWEIWKQGIQEGIMEPQYHGREHLNLKVFNELIQSKSDHIIENLKNRSYTAVQNTGYSTIDFTSAFSFWEYDENYKFKEIIADGLKRFEEVFGYRAIYFNPPAGGGHPIIHEWLWDCGIRYIDAHLIRSEHLGLGKTSKVFNFTGKKNKLGQTIVVRNVVFEPTENHFFDSVGHALKQTEAAFRLNRPAIISSHRVNFSGHISEDNRKKGLYDLRQLLVQIVKKWPDVEFVSAGDLGDIIANS
jgi:hypothetical protein